MRTTIAATCLRAVATAAPAAAPDPAALMKRMKSALEPEKSSTRQLTFRVSGGPWPTSGMGEGPTLLVGQARKRVQGSARLINVVLAPADLRGVVYLVQEGAGNQNKQWVYLPAIRRVREIQSNEAYSGFLNTDFTYVDLGFVSANARYKSLGDAQKENRKTLAIQGIPKETWYYARTVTYVTPDAALPVERDYYDPSNQLWKIERFGEPTDIQGIPTILRMTMEDVQTKNRTDVDVTAVTYDVVLPDGLFEPGDLPNAIASPVWSNLGK